MSNPITDKPFVKEMWEHFLKSMYHGDKLHPNQLMQVKTAFYAGVYSALATVITTTDKLTADDAVELLHKMLTDSDDVLKNIAAGGHRPNNNEEISFSA